MINWNSDTPLNSSTLRLSSNLLVPDSAVQRNSLRSFWSRIAQCFQTSTFYIPNFICLSRLSEHCPSSGNHHCIWKEWFTRGDRRYPRDGGRWTEISVTWSVFLDGRKQESLGMSSLPLHMLHFVTICLIQVARVHSMSIDKNMKTRFLFAPLHSFYNQFGFGGK